MHAVFGALLLALAVVVFQFAYIQHRLPRPSRWIRTEIASQLVCLVIVAMLVSSIGFFVDFFLNADRSGLSVRELGLVASIIAVAALPVAAMRAWWRRLKADALGAGASVHDLRPIRNDTGPDLPPSHGAGGKRQRAA